MEEILGLANLRRLSAGIAAVEKRVSAVVRSGTITASTFLENIQKMQSSSASRVSSKAFDTSAQEKKIKTSSFWTYCSSPSDLNDPADLKQVLRQLLSSAMPFFPLRTWFKLAISSKAQKILAHILGGGCDLFDIPFPTHEPHI
ncbi:hypothetical protein PROFUN_08579 [Planoprotostelium fungivorum]|uniref:Uncharacterized protein n=1 Tax=Planoprotostelium fungivorum TaxID=1890364 RepID=A0A2P6N1U0_9EUKA|nr:hypothetical protein PROFUN_08579 [Planoprotostelium fungivorum]